MKLSTASNQLAVADYFTMFNTVSESAADTDLGSGGALVLPDMIDGQGHTRQLAVGAGKDSNLYLVDRSNMGKFNPANDNAIYQELDGVLPGGVWAMPAYFNGMLYYGSVGNNLQAFPFVNARLANSSSQTAISFAYPGTTPYFRQRQFQWHRLGHGKHFSSRLARLCCDQPRHGVLQQHPGR